MVSWRKRKHGSPRQIGQAFPVEKESMQQKKGMLDKIRGRLSGDHRSQREQDFIDRIKDAIKTKDEKYLVDNDILDPSQMEYLQEHGYIEVDPYSENVELTAKGIQYIYKKRMQRKPDEFEKDGNVSLTAKEKEFMKRKLDEDTT
jgi:mannose-1-phosphate guanylyltransferase